MKILNTLVICILMTVMFTIVSAESNSDCVDAYPICPAIIHMCSINDVKNSCPKTCGICGHYACLKDIGSYEREVTQLKDENTQLRGENIQLQNATTQLKDENTQLKAKISKLERHFDSREYRYEVVKKYWYWSDARDYCTDKGGDLIQNPKVYTLQGRNELRESLNLPTGYYHVGIKRDPNDYEVFRRASDGEEVQLDGWLVGWPESLGGWNYLVWGIYGSDENGIYNHLDLRRYFICEYRG